MGSDAICSLCRQSSLRLLVRDPKQTKPWNGTPPQHRSSRLWWAETNAVWQWYVTPAIYDTVCSKCCVTVKQAFVSLDSCRSSLEGGARCVLTAVGHLDLWLLAEYCLYPRWWKVFAVTSQFPETPPSPIWNTVFKPGLTLVWVFMALYSGLILTTPDAIKIFIPALFWIINCHIAFFAKTSFIDLLLKVLESVALSFLGCLTGLLQRLLWGPPYKARSDSSYMMFHPF